MKKILFAALAIVVLACCNSIQAAPVWNMPAIRIQPNGDTLRCFVTGDEFYQRLHDAQGYTIVMDPSTGYYVYAMMENGQLVPSRHIAGSTNPAALGIQTGLTISMPELMERKKAWDIPEQYRAEMPKSSSAITLLNNIMIFIRFADDTVYTNSFNSVDRLLNDSSSNAVSMYNYFRNASYDKLKIITHFYPAPENNHILSYQDIHPRRYYMPYSAANPDGYREGGQAEREFALIERATAYINENYPVDSTLNLDCDNDGNIDNICYVVKGTYTGWADLLWPHKWNLYDRRVYINGKRVNTFNFMLAGAGEHYFGPSTFCHEMTHTLTAPDLYHYYQWTDIHPAGQWDLMEQNTTPPQHQTAWIKYKYCGWIDSIPTIREQGTYALASIDHPTHNSWKIPSPDPNQFYVVEYRNKHSNMFESGLPTSGMIISRIDTRFEGNASFDKVYNFDEVYILRPDGCDSINGEDGQAAFSPQYGRTSISPYTNPAPMLTQNIPDTTWSIDNIRIEGDSLYFDYIKLTGCRIPRNLNASNVTGSSARLAWESYNDTYIVEYGPADGSQTTVVEQDSNSLNIWGLTKNSEYRFRVKGFCGNENSSFSPWKTFKSGACYDAKSMSVGSGSNQENTLPVATNFRYSYTQQIYNANELGRTSISINTISFNYASNTNLTKNNCKIYLGTTHKGVFDSQTDMVPIDSLTLVYSGPINCTKGWSSIRLDNEFVYDGESNIILAVDDNSGTSTPSTKFKVTTTSYYNGISYYSDSENPDPEDPTNFVGIMARKKFRCNVKFEGCNANGEDSDVSISAVDNSQISIETSHLRITASSENAQTIRLYDITGRLLIQKEVSTEATFTVPQAGVYILVGENGESHKVVVL